MNQIIINSFVIIVSMFLVSCKPVDKTPIFTGTEDVEYFRFQDAPDYSEGISARDYLGNDITSSIIYSDTQVDLNTPGEYPLFYEVTDSEGNYRQIEVKVYVYPFTNKNPFIYTEFQMDLLEIVYHNGQLEPDYLHGILAIDYLGNDITDLLTYDDLQVDLNTPGEYPLFYEITDSEGNYLQVETKVSVYAFNEQLLYLGYAAATLVQAPYQPFEVMRVTSVEELELYHDAVKRYKSTFFETHHLLLINFDFSVGVNYQSVDVDLDDVTFRIKVNYIREGWPDMNRKTIIVVEVKNDLIYEKVWLMTYSILEETYGSSGYPPEGKLIETKNIFE